MKGIVKLAISLAILMVCTSSKANAETYTTSYADCTITFSIFGSGNIAIGTANATCASQHDLSVQVYLYPTGGGIYSNFNSGYGESIGVGAQAPVNAVCDRGDPHAPCAYKVTGFFTVSVDGVHAAGTQLQM